MHSLDAEMCMYVSLIATCLLGRDIINAENPSSMSIGFVSVALGLFFWVAFDTTIWRAITALFVFSAVNGLMSVLFATVVRDAVPKTFWHRAYVVDVGLLNGVVLWQLINF